MKKFAATATGCCIVGLYTLLLSQSNEIEVGISKYPSNVTYGYVQVGTTAHPAFLQVPEDNLFLRSTSKVPSRLHAAEFDRESLFCSTSRRLLTKVALITPDFARMVDDVMLGQGNWSTLDHGNKVVILELHRGR